MDKQVQRHALLTVGNLRISLGEPALLSCIWKCESVRDLLLRQAFGTNATVCRAAARALAILGTNLKFTCRKASHITLWTFWLWYDRWDCNGLICFTLSFQPILKWVQYYSEQVKLCAHCKVCRLCFHVKMSFCGSQFMVCHSPNKGCALVGILSMDGTDAKKYWAGNWSTYSQDVWYYLRDIYWCYACSSFGYLINFYSILQFDWHFLTSV